MPEYAIEVNRVIKEFRVYHRTYANIKSKVTAMAKGLIRKENHTGFELRRALNDVSFKIEIGESVALIGSNGSGKSTLLSILSRVYLPTEGEASIRGRMMSLLELGAGFHHELTGNENIFFNGAMLGLTEEYIAAHYESILDFAGLDPQAMDLPVRMYSSGMQLRLAFAMAVHLDAEVLLLDEGLAVGDEGFQEKCFKKIEEFKTQGRTILMVTHELDHVERLAERVIWIEKGNLRMDGDVTTVLAAYRASIALAV
ncbi:MAG: ABC transporter ATP-binding protein [Capsulimonas sp.]|uniref:ABC transporter ATP-binding protein n=1 Tax=Capsulimonas sp. TaxID=2494211 RepID=UPI003264A189